MPRDITITFSDGTKHQYNNTPDSVTPDDIEKRAKKDYPNKKISNISGGKKKPAGDPLSADPISANARPKGSVASDTPAKTSSSAPTATPSPITKNDELTQVKKNAGLPDQPTSNSGGSFSIKGLRFGMTLEEVIGVTKAEVSDYAAHRQQYQQAMAAYKPGISSSLPIMGMTGKVPKKSASNWGEALSGFTIAGYGGWEAEAIDGKLSKISCLPKAEQIDEFLDLFTSKYGKPKLREIKSRTKAGVELNDYTATWIVQDAVIEMNRHIDRDTGYASIASKSYVDSRAEKYKQDDSKKRADFE